MMRGNGFSIALESDEDDLPIRSSKVIENPDGTRGNFFFLFLILEILENFIRETY